MNGPNIRRKVCVLLVLLCAAGCVCAAQDKIPADVVGYVTRVNSADDFDVNYMRAGFTEWTSIYRRTAPDRDEIVQRDALKLVLGQPVEVYGRVDKKTRALTVRTLILSGSIDKETITGEGVIDAIPAPPQEMTAGDRLVRADGRLIRITAKTAVRYEAPLTAASALTVNHWIAYHGTSFGDGVVVAEKIVLRENRINSGEDKLRKKHEYDASAVGEGKKQSKVERSLQGPDPKRMPAYTDAAMQARVEAIGNRLVPQYQRELPETDPAKVQFRFQVVDEAKIHDALALPSGILLVPHQVVERMENDSQLAAVLADNIASVLERQNFRAQGTRRALTGANAALLGGGTVVPGLSLASLGTNGATTALQQHLLEQSGRVGLALLRDAGFDPYEAPKAWVRLANPKDAPVEKLPPRAAYLYKVLYESAKK